MQSTYCPIACTQADLLNSVMIPFWFLLLFFSLHHFHGLDSKEVPTRRLSICEYNWQNSSISLEIWLDVSFKTLHVSVWLKKKKGLDWAVGGRCFLEVFVLCRSARHHVFMETVCHQPKASRTFWKCFKTFTSSCVITHLCFTYIGMLSHLSLMTRKMRKSRNSLQRQTLVQWRTRGTHIVEMINV